MRHVLRVAVAVDVEQELVFGLEGRANVLIASRPRGQAIEGRVRHQVLLDQSRLRHLCEGALVGGRHVTLDQQVVNDVARFDAAHEKDI